MLALPHEETRQKLLQAMNKIAEELQDLLKNTFITFSGVNYFTQFNHKSKRREVTLLYLETQKDENLKKVEKVTDLFIREMLRNGIITASQLN